MEELKWINSFLTHSLPSYFFVKKWLGILWEIDEYFDNRLEESLKNLWKRPASINWELSENIPVCFSFPYRKALKKFNQNLKKSLLAGIFEKITTEDLGEVSKEILGGNSWKIAIKTPSWIAICRITCRIIKWTPRWIFKKLFKKKL